MHSDAGKYVDSNLTVPNVLTSLRILMALLAASCFIAGVAERPAVVLCIVATLLDAFDGWYARTFSQCSKLGKHLDPLADKLLMAVVYGLFAIKLGSATVWVLVTLIGLRELGMTIFRAYSLRRHRKFIPANRFGKVKMIVQSAVGLAIITYGYFGGAGFDIPTLAVVPSLAAILALSYLSAGVYIWAWYTTQPMPLGQIGIQSAEAVEESGRMVVGK